MSDMEQSVFPQQQLAAIDLGSNSFHLLVVRIVDGSIQVIDKRGEKVQLAAGLDDSLGISKEAEDRALACLNRFAQRLSGMQRSQIVVLGTNTLRTAKNSHSFIKRAESVLGYSIEVIAGIEEARLVYLGVAHTLSDDDGRRLVVDIGGGSTEFIIGEKFKPLALESLSIGCVSFTDKYFSDKLLSNTNFTRASYAAQQEIQRIRNKYRSIGWDNVVGSSGTVRAVNRVLVDYGFTAGGINLDGLKAQRDALIEIEHIDRLDLKGVKSRRTAVYPAGVAILIGIFEALNIESMEYSDGALREGAVYDLLGRVNHEDVRERTVTMLQGRHNVDKVHADRVKQTALAFITNTSNNWSLLDENYIRWISWSADLFEIGLSIAHSNYQKHSAYLVRHSEMPGYSRQSQQIISTLIQGHRRRINLESIRDLPFTPSEELLQLMLILRLAVLLNLSRESRPIQLPSIKVEKNSIELTFGAQWLDDNPMTVLDLAKETDYLKAIDYNLTFK